MVSISGCPQSKLNIYHNKNPARTDVKISESSLANVKFKVKHEKLIWYFPTEKRVVFIFFN